MSGHQPVARALTPRELDVLRLGAKGMGNREIGQHVGLTDATVRNIFYGLGPVLGSKNRTHAVAIAYQLGLLGEEVPS